MVTRGRLQMNYLCRRLAAPVVAGLSAAALFSGGAAAGDKALPQSVQELDAAFRSRYLSVQNAVSRAISPVIIAGGGKVILISAGKREESAFIPPAYDILKTADHVPLAIFAELVEATAAPLRPEKRRSLGELRALIVRAEADIDQDGLQPAALVRTHKAFDSSLEFLDRVLAADRVSSEELRSFCQVQTPILMANAYDAVALELGSLHRQVMRWKERMSADEWRALRVVVMDVHMARTGERTMQYFEKLLGEAEEGRRIVYLEGSNDESAALALLGKHIVDARIGQAFFSDPMRMHRDLLSDAAEEYLRKELKLPAEPPH